VFTGIIEHVGTLERIAALAAGRRLTVGWPLVAGEIRTGESIAIDGACMTVVDVDEGTFSVDVSSESLRRTTLGERRVGERVNLERSMPLGARLGGHIVTGHVDGTGVLRSVAAEGESAIYTFEIGPEMARLLVEKGSVAVDGISLTCFNCRADRFDVAVIPHTAQATTLGAKTAGARVNVENDLLAKYVEKLVEPLRSARA
jgi:riboflavin synthase